MKNYNICAFGKIVSKRLLDEGLPRKWLEKECSVEQTALSRYIRGETPPPAVLVYRISKALDIDCMSLLEAVASEAKTRNV